METNDQTNGQPNSVENKAAEGETDWKAEAEKWRGRAHRAKKRLEKLQTAKPDKTEDKPKTNDLDYGQLSYLAVKGYETEEELGFIKKMMEKTGMSLKETIADEYVQNRIAGMRETKATKDATPSSTKRSATSGKDTVDYWLAKGELPPADQVQLRRDVLNARIKKESQKGMFSSNPIVNA